MTSRKNKHSPKLSPMKTMRLVEASKKMAGIRFDQMRDMTPAEQGSWAETKRGTGQPCKPDIRETD